MWSSFLPGTGKRTAAVLLLQVPIIALSGCSVIIIPLEDYESQGFVTDTYMVWQPTR
jgi:hypothetical protein